MLLTELEDYLGVSLAWMDSFHCFETQFAPWCRIAVLFVLVTYMLSRYEMFGSVRLDFCFELCAPKYV